MELNETNSNIYSKCALFTPAERNSVYYMNYLGTGDIIKN